MNATKSHADRAHRRLAACPGPKANEAWRHYKGGLCTIVAVALRESTLEALVVYRDAEGRTWARAMEEFVEMVDGVPRFVRDELADHQRGRRVIPPAIAEPTGSD